MADPLSIIGAISAILSLLDLGRQGINTFLHEAENFQEYGAVIDGLERDLETIERLLTLWEAEWEIGNSEKGGEGVRYFGIDGWEEIKKQRAIIDETILNLVGLISPLMPSDQNARAPEKKRKRERLPVSSENGRAFLRALPLDRLEALKERKISAQNVYNRSTLMQKVSFVCKDEGDKIRKKIEELKKRYEILKLTSERYFVVIYQGLSLNTPLQTRRDEVRKAWDSNYALRFKELAIAFTNAIPPTLDEPKDIGFDLRPHMNSKAAEGTVQFKLITERMKSQGSYELSVSALGPQVPQGIKPYTAFSSLYKQVPGKCIAHLQIPQSNLCYCITPAPLSKCRTLRLADELIAKVRLGYGEVLELAYRLADSCLLLLNTSWMCGFSSESLVIRVDEDDSTGYSLGIRECDRCILLHSLQHTLYPEAYSIGTLFIELATQRKVRDINLGENPKMLHMVDGMDLTLDEAIIATKDELGPSFQQVVEYCFNRARQPRPHLEPFQREDILLDSLYGFYEEVFLPLQKLRENLRKRKIAMPGRLRVTSMNTFGNGQNLADRTRPTPQNDEEEPSGSRRVKRKVIKEIRN